MGNSSWSAGEALAELAAIEQLPFRCICDPRFTGSRCQHRLDSCATNRCENGGQCVDTSDGFECRCRAGFAGLNCESQLRQCAAEPCHAPNTLHCQESASGPRCLCRAGFGGDRCEEELDECAAEPCLNGGTCRDREADFECDCPAGWSGKTCDQEAASCSSQQPCLNEARCVDLFEDFFCVCPSGTDGKRCATSPARCVGGPCQNGATCRDFGSGLNCTCASGSFAGSGCQWRREPCSELHNPCRNGATCHELAGTNSPGGADYRCTCAPGWTGAHCDQDVVDCVPGACPANAVCVDLEGGFYCRCPAHLTGDDCRKPVEADFDLRFGALAKSGSASSTLPFELGAELGALTVSAWVQFEAAAAAGPANRRTGATSGPAQPATGAFLSLYAVRALLAEPGRELLRLDESGASVHLFANQTALFLPYLLDVPINDGQWHLLNVIWDGRSGNLSLMTDGAVAATRAAYGLGERLGAHFRHARLQLGARLGAGGAPVAGSGFVGRLSRVSVLGRALEAGSEVARQVRSCRAAQPAEAALLQAWSPVLAEQVRGAVERELPSSCGQRRCPAGLAGDECAQVQQDKQPPRVLLCPPDMWLVTPNASTPVHWDEPHFADELGRPVAVAEQSNLRPGAALGQGTFHLAYLAADEAGNTASCEFRIRVLRDFCPMPLAPINGRAHCKAWGPAGRFRTCQVECNQGFEFSQPVARHYVCGAEGFWRPTGEPGRELVFPACTARHEAQRIYRMSVSFGSAATCSEAGRRVLHAKLHENLLRLDQAWRLCSAGPSSSPSGRCQHLRVQVRCTRQPAAPATGSTEGRLARRHAPAAPADELYTVEVSFPANADPVASSSGDPASGRRNISDILREAVFRDQLLDVRDTLPNVRPLTGSLELASEWACPAGSVLAAEHAACAECAPGTHFDEQLGACLECPAHTYQDQTRASQCKPCPQVAGKVGVTAATGARSADQCRERCPAGSFYDERAQLCRACGRGAFQPSEGQFTCLACPPGLTTRHAHATSRHECRPECEPGQQLNALGACEPCPLGHFRPPGAPTCEPCPAGLTTETVGSAERRLCNLALCPQGNFLNLTSDRCQACPRGSYQPLEQRHAHCLPCPPDTSSELEGATHLDNCTNPCQVEGRAQVCQPNAFCVFSRDARQFSCECKPKYRMDELSELCVYVCDDFCLNGGQCNTNNELHRPRCDCPASFYGERCERKSDLIYIASGIGLGLGLILLVVLLVWMICVRTAAHHSLGQQVAATPTTKQGLQALHAAAAAASQLDFAHLAAPQPAFYYGPAAAATGAAYAESLAPSLNHSAAYAHYYDDDDDHDHDDHDHEDGADPMGPAHQEATQLHPDRQQDHHQHQHQHHWELPPPPPTQAAHLYNLNASHQQPLQPGEHQMADKDELYDRLKRHLYTGNQRQGDTTDSGEEAPH